MKISIITATYNSAATLEQTMSSVVKQSYKNIEHIIVDGASNDSTVGIIEKYQRNYPDIIRFISEPDDGIYYALNKGISMAAGDYIQVLGSDDCLYDYDTIAKVGDVLEKEEADVLCTGVWVVDEVKHTENYFSPMQAAAPNFDGRNLIHNQGVFIRSEIIKERLFDTSFRLAADYNLFLSCYYDDKVTVAFKDIPVAYFGNKGASNNADISWQEQNMVWEKYGLTDVIERENRKYNKLHNRFKRFLKKHNLYDVLNFHVHHRRIEKDRLHRCNNEICRWCEKL